MCSSDSDSNAKVVKRPSRAKAGIRRAPRRCAAAAARKITLLGGLEDADSQSVCTRGRRRRRKPLRVAGSAAGKTGSDSEGEGEGDVPTGLAACGGEPPGADSEGSTKSCHPPPNGDSDSEGVPSSEPRDRPARRARRHKTHIAPSRTKSSLFGSSEEDSRSHMPGNERGRRCSPASALEQKTAAETNFEEELSYGLRRWNGRRLRTYGKAAFRATGVAPASPEGAKTDTKRKRLHPKPGHVRDAEAPGHSEGAPDASPQSESELGSVTESEVDCADETKTKKRKAKGKAKVNVRKGKPFTANAPKSVRQPRQSKRPRLNVEDNDWEDLDCAESKRVLRRSKIKTRNQGRRTVRYHDGDDDRNLENVFDFDDCTL